MSNTGAREKKFGSPDCGGEGELCVVGFARRNTILGSQEALPSVQTESTEFIILYRRCNFFSEVKNLKYCGIYSMAAAVLSIDLRYFSQQLETWNHFSL